MNHSQSLYAWRSALLPTGVRSPRLLPIRKSRKLSMRPLSALQIEPRPSFPYWWARQSTAIGLITWSLSAYQAEVCSTHLSMPPTRSSGILTIFNQSEVIYGRSWRLITGSAARTLFRMSTRFFRAIHDQLGQGTYDPGLERELQSAAGELAEVVGWLAYDAEAHDLTRRMNQESLYFSRLAGDRAIELLTLQNSSMHAASQGRPREALQIVRSVLARRCLRPSRLAVLRA